MTHLVNDCSKTIGDIDYFSFNGAFIECDGKRIISSIDQDTIRRIGCFCKKTGIFMQTYSGNAIVSDRICPELEADPELKLSEHILISNYEEYSLGPSAKALCADFSRDENELLEMMRNEFPDLSISLTNGGFIEVNHMGINKVYALSTICSHYGIQKEEVITIGDSLNDLEMIEWSGCGIAVANSNEMLKKAADQVTTQSYTDGVIEAIE